MKSILLFSLFVSVGFAQLSGIGPARTSTDPVTIACTVGSSPPLIYKNGNVDTIYTAQGSPCVYAAAPGGSTSVLTANGVGASGAAGSNKLTGPANSVIGTDGSGNGAAVTGATIANAIGATAVQKATAADTATTAGSAANATNAANLTTPLAGAALGSATSTTLRDLPSVRDTPYNLIPDLVHMADAAMTASSGVLTTAHTFVSGDVGKTCVVGGAGAEGPGANLRTTIASVTSGHATLTATAANTVTAQLADCGTLNEAAAIITATKGSGFTIPSGAYLLDNTGAVNAGGGLNLQFWTGTIQFQTGASIVCVATGSSGALGCVGGDQAVNVNVVNPVIGFAGATLGAKTNGSANAISFTKGIDITISNPIINSTGAGSCIVNVNGVRFHVSGTLTMKQCNLNGAYNVSSQDTVYDVIDATLTGDYALEGDTSTAAGMNANATGLSVNSIHCNNTFGCLLFDGMQKASVTNVISTTTCGGVSVLNGFQNAKNINIANVTIDGSGTVANANWPGCTTAGTGTAFQVQGGDGVHVGSARITNTSNSPLILVSSPYVSIDTLSYSGITSVATKPLLIAGNTTVRINNFHVDTSTVNIVAGVSPAGVSPVIATGNTFLFGQFWDFQNVCTLGGCSLNALSLPTNTQFNINSIILNDSQATPTGSRVQSTGTTAQSTINNVQGLVPSGAPSASVDGNTCLDCASFAQGSTITLNGVGNPTANKTFVFPNTTLALTGTTPASASGNGTAGAAIFSATSTQGGDTTGTTGQTAGNGGGITLTGGIGGGASTGSTNGNGGSLTLNGGAAGGGTGTAGSRGNIFTQTGGGQFVVGTGTPSAGGAAFYVSTSAVGMEVNRSGSGGIFALDFNGTRTAQIVALTGGGGKLANASNSSTSFQWDGSGNSFFGTAQQSEITAAGLAILVSTAGTGTATFAPQAGAGTGATAVCATSHVCDSFSGEVTLTSGSVGTPATGSQLIITLPITRTNQPNCAVDVYGGTTFLGITKTQTTSTITISAGVALTFATTYTVDYVCGGN